MTDGHKQANKTENLKITKKHLRMDGKFVTTGKAEIADGCQAKFCGGMSLLWPIHYLGHPPKQWCKFIGKTFRVLFCFFIFPTRLPFCVSVVAIASTNIFALDNHRSINLSLTFILNHFHCGCYLGKHFQG